MSQEKPASPSVRVPTSNVTNALIPPHIRENAFDHWLSGQHSLADTAKATGLSYYQIKHLHHNDDWAQKRRDIAEEVSAIHARKRLDIQLERAGKFMDSHQSASLKAIEIIIGKLDSALSPSSGDEKPVELSVGELEVVAKTLKALQGHGKEALGIAETQQAGAQPAAGAVYNLNFHGGGESVLLASPPAPIRENTE